MGLFITPVVPIDIPPGDATIDAPFPIKEQYVIEANDLSVFQRGLKGSLSNSPFGPPPFKNKIGAILISNISFISNLSFLIIVRLPTAVGCVISGNSVSGSKIHVLMDEVCEGIIHFCSKK